MKNRHRLWLAAVLFVLCGVGAVAQETGPEAVIDVDLPIGKPGSIDELPVVAEGVVWLPEDCGYCYLSTTQYRIEVPEGVETLSIELVNTTDVFGDIDLIVRQGEPVTEDESAYYYSYRTYGGGGEERLDLPEEGILWVEPGEYYIAVVSFVEDGTTFQLRVAATAEVITPDAVAVDAAVPVSGSLQPGESSPDLGWQYTFQVMDQTELLFIEATSSEGNLDLFAGTVPAVLDGQWLIAEFQLRGSGSDEQLVLGDPIPTKYWIGLENRSREVLDYTLMVTAFPGIRPVSATAEIAGTVGWESSLPEAIRGRLVTGHGMLGLEQLRIEVPDDATGLRLHLRGMEAGDLGLHVRSGTPVEVMGGDVIADLSMRSGTEKELALRDASIPGSVLFVALEALSQGEKAYLLDVEFLD